MKRVCVPVAAGLWALTVCPASAQIPVPDLVRPDLAVSIGWLNVNKSDLDSHNDWYNRGVQGAATFGWYWSVHLKTEIEASASTRVEFRSSTEEFFNGFRTYAASDHNFRTRRLSLSQQYQFGENAWVHSHLAAGLDFNWETSNRRDREVIYYDFNARQSILVRRPVVHQTRTELHVRPFAAAGFKAYMSRRSFFRSDLRIVTGRGIEEVLVRVGLGMDF